MATTMKLIIWFVLTYVGYCMSNMPFGTCPTQVYSEFTSQRLRFGAKTFSSEDISGLVTYHIRIKIVQGNPMRQFKCSFKLG